MKLLDKAKQGWENIWLPRLQEGKTKVELERDKNMKRIGYGITQFLQ